MGRRQQLADRLRRIRDDVRTLLAEAAYPGEPPDHVKSKLEIYHHSYGQPVGKAPAPPADERD